MYLFCKKGCFWVVIWGLFANSWTLLRCPEIGIIAGNADDLRIYIERLGWILTVHSLYQKASWPSYDWSIKPTLLWILILSNSLLDGERTFNLILMISLIKPDHFIAFTSLVRKKKMCTNIQEWTIDIRTTVHTKEAAVDDHLVPKTQTLQFA